MRQQTLRQIRAELNLRDCTCRFSGAAYRAAGGSVCGADENTKENAL